MKASGGWMLSEQISPTNASSASICCRSICRTVPTSDTLKINVPPTVLPNAANSSATDSRRGALTRRPVKATSLNSTRLSSPSSICFSNPLLVQTS